MDFKKTIGQQQKATGAVKQIKATKSLLDMEAIKGICEVNAIPLEAITEAINKAISSDITSLIYFDFYANDIHYYIDMITDRYIIRDRENCGKIKYFYHVPKQFRLYGYTLEDCYYNRSASEQDGSPILNYHGKTIEIEI